MGIVRFFGIFNVVIGVVFIIFNQGIGGFLCNIGKSLWKRAEDNKLEFVRTMSQFAPIIFDEQKLPIAIIVLGFVFIIQGLFFYCIAPLINK